MMMRKLSLIFLASIFLPAYLFAQCDPLFITSADSNGDTICVGVQIDFTNTSDLGGEILTFKQWNFGDASPLVTTEDASHTYTQSGMYTVVYTLASQSCTGLIFKDTIYVIDPPSLQSWGTDPICYETCTGAASIFINGVHNNYTIEWDDALQQETLTAAGLCEGEYIARVRDDYSCEVFSPMVALFNPAELIVDAGSDVFICEGDQWVFSDADVVSGGVFPFTYLWTPGDSLNNDTLFNPIITAGPNAYGVYTLTVTDADGCSGSNDLQVTQTQGQIHGTIFDETGTSPQAGATVYLIKRGNPDTQWETYDTYTTGSGGDYHFVNLPLVDYIVLAEPPGGTIGYMPSYYGGGVDSSSWQDADITSVECGTAYFNTDINLIHLPEQLGTCTFEGYVYLVGCDLPPCKTQTEDPIPLIDVIVKKTPPGNAIAWTQTGDGTNEPILYKGQFRFENMPASLDSTYSFVVNIPGLGMQGNYSIEVAIDDSLYGNLNFYVDTTPGTGGIFTYNPLSVESIKFKQHEMIAYPNPFADNCELRFTNTENMGFTFTLFDITGKQIIRDEKQEGNAYTIKTPNLDQGIYIAEVKTGDEVFRTRVMKK